jgi:hypothetical protein
MGSEQGFFSRTADINWLKITVFLLEISKRRIETQLTNQGLTLLNSSTPRWKLSYVSPVMHNVLKYLNIAKILYDVRLPRLYMQCAKIIHDVSTGL